MNERTNPGGRLLDLHLTLWFKLTATKQRVRVVKSSLVELQSPQTMEGGPLCTNSSLRSGIHVFKDPCYGYATGIAHEISQKSEKMWTMFSFQPYGYIESTVKQLRKTLVLRGVYSNASVAIRLTMLIFYSWKGTEVCAYMPPPIYLSIRATRWTQRLGSVASRHLESSLRQKSHPAVQNQSYPRAPPLERHVYKTMKLYKRFLFETPGDYSTDEGLLTEQARAAASVLTTALCPLHAANKARENRRCGSTAGRLPARRKHLSLENVLTCFQCAFYAFYCSSAMQIKNVGGIPSLSHRNLTLQAGCSPKASVSSLEKVPSVILGCDLIAEAHRDSETRTVPAAIGCPIQPCASRSLFVPLANRENRYHEHHLPHTVPGIKRPPKGRGRQHWDF